MKDKTKRNIIIVTGLAISAALAVMLAIRLTPPPTKDVQIPEESSAVEDVTPQAPDITVPSDLGTEITEKEDEDIKPQPIDTEPTDAPEPTTGDDKGEEQTIQPDPEPMPGYTDEQLSDPAQTPDGEPATPPTEENPTPPQIQDPPTQPTEPVNPSGGLPGFDNVPNMGDSENVYVDGMVENGNKVGIMD